MRILLTGSTGLLGPYVADKLRAHGHEVLLLQRNIVRRPRTALETRTGDLRMPWTLWDALDGCDALVACTHIRFAETCIYACKKMGIARYVQLSSARVNSQVRDEARRTVIQGEAAIRRSDLDYTILRPTMIFDGERDLNIRRLADWFRKRRAFPLIDKGHALVQPVYAQDCAEIVARVCGNSIAIREALPVAGGEPLEWRECVALVCRAVRGEDPIFIPIPRWAALAVAKTIPGFDPKTIVRMTEDRSLDISHTVEIAGIVPRRFEEALTLAPLAR